MTYPLVRLPEAKAKVRQRNMARLPTKITGFDDHYPEFANET